MIADLLRFEVEKGETVFRTEDGKQHNRMETRGASEAYTCLRRSGFEKSGVPKDEEYVENRGFFIRGHVGEAWVVDTIRKHMPAEDELLYAGEDQVTFKKGRTSATPDGLYIKNSKTKKGPTEEFLPEFKTLDPRSNFDVLKPQHKMQANVQMGLVRELTKYKPEYAVLVYLDCSDFGHIVEHRVTFDPQIYKQAQARADQVFENLDDPMKLPAEGTWAGECRYCPWQVHCTGQTVRALPKGGLGNVNQDIQIEMEALLTQRASLNEQSSTLQTTKGKVEDRIKSILREKDIQSMKAGGWSVSYLKASGRRSLDQKKLEESGVDLTDFYKIGRDFDRLTIRKKSE